MALAFFDDVDRGGGVLTRLNRFGRWAADTFQAVRKDAHGHHADEMKHLVDDTARLIEKIRDSA
ncbi:hypothetical protein FDG2_2059 [Candidatus Protofrankia californiensis]|uniref:Uncharacterized protein n=1 Tax=Candidatus Protofrankia californiensis TaxID=1839754 RepID=A0A1C3NWS2_9ACTN|nr:hypothetical protein FDG2_2059 [Candidatus Protofrankia californiensis]